MRVNYPLQTTAPLESEAEDTRHVQVLPRPSRGQPVFEFGGMHVPHECPYGLGDVRSRLVRKPHQTAYQFVIWPIPVGPALVKLLKKNISLRCGVPTCGHARLLDGILRVRLLRNRQ